MTNVTLAETVGRIEKKVAENNTLELPAKVYCPRTTNSNWDEKIISSQFYESPYQFSLYNPQNGEDKKRLWSQTKSIFAYGAGVAGVLALMPSEFTKWDKSDKDLLGNWWDNVSSGPVWDRDAWYINYIGHPYFGGVYYQVARKSGYRQWDAFVYSFLMSTFYWEYGLEAFAEIPSIQNLLVTPVSGWLYGEWAFRKEREIIESGGTINGSKWLGSTALFLLDPVDNIGRNINSMLGRELIKAGTGYVNYQHLPVGDSVDHRVIVSLRFQYDEDGQSYFDKSKLQDHTNNHIDDPVNKSIIGLSLGVGQLNLNGDKNTNDPLYPVITFGLYFSPRFSVRLSYARTRVKAQTSGQRLTYENYSLDAQYYFNSQSRLRPYLIAGIGEMMWEKNQNLKTFQLNSGIGLHYQFSSKWALQADWRLYRSTSRNSTDQTMAGSVIYRFGDGE